MQRSRTLRLACALALVLTVTTLTACVTSEKDDGVSIEQLEKRAREIGTQILAETDGLKLAQENIWGVGQREGDVDFFGQGDPPWWVQADGFVSLAVDEEVTPKELAERMSASLEAHGWIPKEPWPGRLELPFTKTDDLGTWSLRITYQTEPSPKAQRVMISLTSPHTNKDPEEPY